MSEIRLRKTKKMNFAAQLGFILFCTNEVRIIMISTIYFAIQIYIKEHSFYQHFRA